MTKPLIYLASPYSHPDPAVREARYRAAVEAAARIMAAGRVDVIAPIVMSHEIARAGGLGTGWETWARVNRRLIAACDEVWVLALDGWKKSEGIKAEERIARALGKPALMVQPGRSQPVNWALAKAEAEAQPRGAGVGADG